MIEQEQREISGEAVGRKGRKSRFDMLPQSSQVAVPPAPPLPPPIPLPPSSFVLANSRPDAFTQSQLQPHLGSANLIPSSFSSLVHPQTNVTDTSFPSTSSSSISSAATQQATLNSLSADAFLAQMHEHIAVPIKDEYGTMY